MSTNLVAKPLKQPRILYKFDELNADYSLFNGQLLDKPRQLVLWSPEQLDAYFESDGEVCPAQTEAKSLEDLAGTTPAMLFAQMDPHKTGMFAFPSGRLRVSLDWGGQVC